MERLTELVKLPDGKLRIQLTEAGKEERDYRQSVPFKIGYWLYLDYWLEWEMGNGWDYVLPYEVGALTSDHNTLLSDTAVRGDYGELVSVGTIWFDNWYAERDPVTELLSEGYIDFWPAVVESAPQIDDQLRVSATGE